LGITCGDAANSVTYVEAWGSWASGPDNEYLCLWGLYLYWWGRIGQLVAFTGSLLLAAELVDDPKKFKELADWLRNMGSTLKRAAWEYGLGLAILLVLLVFLSLHLSLRMLGIRSFLRI
jgi:hypothetical protein